MESSEDDAGTATNASRRASAREKDVGLAEDVNATSSFQQKPSEVRSSCQTPAMSEDNFDGESVPSPSSQDVNTSTEAILDMIDEIVDGPGAPKRLPLTSEFVDALNEEFATTSYNLNIIQESAKSDCENISVLPDASVNISDSKTTLPLVIDTPAECSTPSDIPANIVKTDSVDTLPASSSIPESDEKAVSTESEASVALDVKSETSTSCPLPNIPSSSEVQTDKNVSDISASEPQDRTVKCVTSSDTRDNVTVESAESTSSDSSVSESKALLVEPQTRSPLRRRLVRPVPSDRRPDSTVSSTVDSQTVDIPATEGTSSENITKDVTSSSDAVPTIHGNEKPDEIRNVSEINFCKAETSVSPPKKIKLIRQKIITGTSNRETPLSQISVLAEKEQCQSTSSDNHSVNLPIPTIESSSSDSLSKYDLNATQISDNSNCVIENRSEEPQKGSEKVCSDEHSEPSIEPSIQSPKNDDSNKGNYCEVPLPKNPILNPLQSLAPDVNQTEQESSSLPTSNLSELITNIKENDLKQGYVCNTYDKEHKSIDFIPLRLSPRRKEYQSNCSIPELESTVLRSKNTEIESTKIDLDSRISKLEPKPSELEFKTHEYELESGQHDLQNKHDRNEDHKESKLESSSNRVELKSSPLDTGNNKIETKTSVLESRNTALENTKKLPSKSSDSESKASKISSNNELQSRNSELTSKSLDCDSKCEEFQSQSTAYECKSTSTDIVLPSTGLELKTPQLESQNLESTSMVVVESTSTGPEVQNMEIEPESINVKSQTTAVESTSTEQETDCQVLEFKSEKCKSQNLVVESKITVDESQSTDIKGISIETELTTEHDFKSTNTVIETGNSEVSTVSDIVIENTQLDSEHSETQSRSAEHIVKDIKHEAQVSEVELKNTEIESKKPTIELKNSDIETMNTETEIKNIELDSKNSTIESSISVSMNCQPDTSNEYIQEDQKKVPPIKLNITRSSTSGLSESKLEVDHSSINKNNVAYEESDSTKQVPKLTIKLKQPEEMKSPVPKLTIRPIRPPVEQDMDEKIDHIQQVPCVTKINIKPIVKPVENVNDKPMKAHLEGDKDSKQSISEQLPCVTKLNIKPILKPPEKINDIHRKSSSSEISESEYSENDETTSTSDQASASDHGSSDVVPKVTIKLGKPGTESEGKFYTEKNVPKLTIKGIQQDEKLIISQSDDVEPEKVPKLTIKTVTKTESQPLSPKLTIKPLKPPDSTNKECEIPKIKISTELFSSTTEGTESHHVPKITIKPVTRMDCEIRTPKKSTAMCDSPEHIPVVTKLNIKPILKPTDCGETSEGYDEKVPVVSKLNIKPVIKPKDNNIGSSVDDVPKITKLNIKPLKNPEDKNSEDFKDCDDLNADISENSIPIVTKINIKPIVKPQEEEKEKDSENQSSETSNSSDDNADHIPVVTKLNIKPIVKPDDLQESSKSVSSSEQSIPVVTKLNIKPLVKPGESSPSSPKKEHSKIDVHSTTIPVVTKLNIKPVMRPEEVELQKPRDDNDDKTTKNPPLVMKINMKSMTENYNHDSSHKDNVSNYVGDGLLSIASRIVKMSNEVDKPLDNKEHKSSEPESVNDLLEPRIIAHSPVEKSLKQNCVPDEESTEKRSIIKKSSLHSPITKSRTSESATEKQHSPKIATITKSDSTGSPHHETKVAKEGKISISNETHISQEYKNINYRSVDTTESNLKQPFGRQSVQNCTLLKKLLENTRDSLDKNFEVSQVVHCTMPSDRSESNLSGWKDIMNIQNLVESGKSSSDRTNTRCIESNLERRSSTPDKVNDSLNKSDCSIRSMQELAEKFNENVTKPLEITIGDKISNQSSGQDSPRIILKINKTDHGPSAKIITEDVKRPENYAENTQDNVNDKQSPKRHVANSRKKQIAETSLNLSSGKRLRSSRIVENTEKSQIKRNVGKRPSTAETTPPQNKEPELSVLQTKRLKLGQLLSGNKSLSLSPVSPTQTSPTKTNLETKPGVKAVNHSLLNNENCSKNGNSKLHNILSNLQAKQIQSLPFNNTNCSEKAPTLRSDIECNTSMSSSDVVEITHVENSHPELQQMIINENSDFRDFTGPEDTSQDPLEVDNLKLTPVEVPPPIVEIPKPVELTPQPKKRGRPRKLPVSEGAKPPVVTLPVPALEERPQRSLRLMRDRPTILHKPRGRGRGRGGRRSEATPTAELETVTVIETAPEEQTDEKPTGEIDPTSSRIKLPRMTEALDKMPSVCTTPLSSRRRNSSGTFSSTGETSELKGLLDSTPLKDEFPNTPEPSGSGRGRGGRGSRGGRGRTPRGRGRGRGGGRGAMYMKETMGIYGRVCGPATTTVQLFEEETCMMDDNATPAKPSHLLDEDSQGSVKSSTNESNKMKKSKFADLFDSSKVWTAGDVKEYTWPPPDKADGESKVMMIQEQVAMFLGVKSFKRRYPELKRRTIGGEERDYVLSKGLVTEALCDLGITAVDASEVLDIMLSDYPHKYEEYRSHQRERQLTEALEEPAEESKPEEKVSRVEMKPEKPVEVKPEPPKIDPEKTRQDMAAAAIASASEWNARANAARRGACADLQSLTVLRARARPAPPARAHLRPPAGFYPHALLPGQYQHSYRLYEPDQLRYFPLNTVLAAPPAPTSVTDWSSDSEPEWGSRCSSSDDSDIPTHHSAKRKKLIKVKRSSHAEASTSSVREEPKSEEVVDTCRVCKLRLEANRKYTHERFLVCANCNAKLHPSCVELSADTIRKCREYPWQCAECKTCCSCRQPADDDKMLFCDLCDRGFHIYCVGLDTVPSGRWHCVECAICKSCGARSPSGPSGAGAGGPGAGPADWHHQTRRGPGGHKVYSHSLCTPCARAYRIGRYCPLCERSFIGPKGTMQLVICKLCDRQLHQECVRQTGAALRVLDHTCGWCRRGGITSRAAAVRLAPRTIATLFMAKRRFNKYAHRQYMESRLRQDDAPSPPSPPSELV